VANQVVHFEVIGTDAAQLRTFYSQAFGWNLASEPNTGDSYAVVENGGSLTGGIGACPDGEYPGHVTFYVGVEDITSSLQAVERFGGKTLRGPIPLPNSRGQFAHIEDPQGHMIGLVQPA
jgi:predicted enzyme related to lactoylglutathione lyase